jgi:hypothetical protein
MDENGNCYPSQARIAHDLGIHRQRVNERIQALLKFRFQGQPVLTMTKNRKETSAGGRWANNVYHLDPIANFAIFNEKETLSVQNQLENSPSKPYVRKSGHRPMSGKPDTGYADTNQTQGELTRSFNVNDCEKTFPERRAENSARSAEDEIRVGSLVIEMLEVCRDRHSRGFYRLVAQKVPAELIRAALSETKYQATMRRIRKSRGAFFTDEIQRLARERGIDLGINIPKQQRTPITAGNSPQ